MKRLFILLVGLGVVLVPTVTQSVDDPSTPQGRPSGGPPAFRAAVPENDPGPMELLPAARPSTALPTGKGIDMGVYPDNGLMSINFLEADIREIFSAIAMEREINVAMAKEVSGNVSIHLFHVDLEEALDSVALAGGVRYRKQGAVYYVYKPKQENSAQSEGLEMKIFKLKYMDVDKFGNILEAIPSLKTVKIHEASKTIIVEDTPENIRKVETIVNHWDARPKQVLIEAKILEIVLTDGMSLGVDWEQLLGDVRIATGGFSKGVIPTDGSISPVPDEGSGGFANIITGAGTKYQFTAAIDMLRTRTRVNTLSTPKVLAIHGKPAKVQVGGQQGYRVTTTNLGVATETIEFIDTGTILEITPYVNGETEVLLNVKPEINSAEIGEGGIPVVKSTVVTTWLLAKSGETVFIGGLIQDIKTKDKKGIPYISDVPGLGYLFGRTQDGKRKSELVVLITPQIVEAELDRVNRENKERVDKKKETMFPEEAKMENDPEANMSDGPEAKIENDREAEKEDEPNTVQEEARPKKRSKAASVLPAYMSAEE